MKLKLGNFVDHQHIFLLFHFFHDLLLRFRLWRLLGCWASWACGGFFHAFGRFQWFWENSISERRRSCQFVQDWRNWKYYFCWSNSKACNWSSMFFWIIILLKTSYSSAAQTCAIMKYVLCISKNVKNHIGFQNSKRKKNHTCSKTVVCMSLFMWRVSNVHAFVNCSSEIPISSIKDLSMKST